MIQQLLRSAARSSHQAARTCSGVPLIPPRQRWLLPCDWALRFGSAAGRDGGLDSDLDILPIQSKGVHTTATVWCEATRLHLRQGAGRDRKQLPLDTENSCLWMG